MAPARFALKIVDRELVVLAFYRHLAFDELCTKRAFAESHGWIVRSWLEVQP